MTDRPKTHPWDDPSLTWGKDHWERPTVMFVDENGNDCCIRESGINGTRGELLDIRVAGPLLLDQPQLAVIAPVLQFFADHGRLPTPEDEGPVRAQDLDVLLYTLNRSGLWFMSGLVWGAGLLALAW